MTSRETTCIAAGRHREMTRSLGTYNDDDVNEEARVVVAVVRAGHRRQVPDIGDTFSVLMTRGWLG